MLRLPARSVSLTLPMVLGLLFLGLQHLFLVYMVLAYLPFELEPPTRKNLLDIWLHSPEHGDGIPAELALVNTLFVVYLWVSHRAPGGRWWERASPLFLLGLALLFLVSQYALLRLIHLPPVPYSIEIIRPAG